MSKLSVQIKDLPEYSSWLSSVNAGTYKLKIRATADNYLPSDYTTLSDTITYKVFSITPTLNNITTTQTLRKVGEDYTEDIIFNLSANGTTYTVPVTAPTVTGSTGTYTRSSNTSASLKLTNITSNVSFTVTADGALTAPTIRISGNTLLITDNSGKTGNSYEIYVNDSLKLTVTSTSVIMDNLNLGVGTSTIKVKAKNTNYITSAFSNSVTWKVYSIMPTLTGLTASTSNATAVAQSVSSVTLEYNAETGYITPSTAPTVTNATVTYNRVSDSQCRLTLTNITGNITFTLTAIKRLDTPTNVTVSDAYVVEFDKVENATSYDVLVDSVVIGNYKAVPDTMTLKAGLYRWNDALTDLDSLSDGIWRFQFGLRGSWCTGYDKPGSYGGDLGPMGFTANDYPEGFGYDVGKGWQLGDDMPSASMKYIRLMNDQQVPTYFYDYAINKGNLKAVTQSETWRLNTTVSSEPTDMFGFVTSAYPDIYFALIQPNDLQGVEYDYYEKGTQNGKRIYPTDSGVWTDDNARLITLDAPATGDLLTWLEANAVKVASDGTITFSLPEAPAKDWRAEGYITAQGNIQVTPAVYDAMTALNAGGSLTTWGNTCGLNIDSSYEKLYSMGIRLEVDPDGEQEIVDGKYKITIVLGELTKQKDNDIIAIEYDYTNNTATISNVESENVDIQNHTITFEGTHVDGSTLYLFAYKSDSVTYGFTIATDTGTATGTLTTTIDANNTVAKNAVSNYSSPDTVLTAQSATIASNTVEETASVALMCSSTLIENAFEEGDAVNGILATYTDNSFTYTQLAGTCSNGRAVFSFTNSNLKDVSSFAILILSPTATVTFTLPQPTGVGTPAEDWTADGYQRLQGDISVSYSVFNAMSALNAGGSLVDWGNTCGLTIPSNYEKMFPIGIRMKADDDVEIVDGKYDAPLNISTLTKDTDNNIKFIEYDFTNNTATMTDISAEDSDVDNHIVNIKAEHADGTTLYLLIYEKATPLTVSWAMGSESGTNTAGESATIAAGGGGYGGDTATFTCSGGTGTYTYTLTKVRGDSYCTATQASNIITVDMGSSSVEYTHGDYTLIITSDTESITYNIHYSYACLTADTLITLANGTQKRIDEITLSDKVLSYNPSTMQLEADEITYTDSKEDKTFTEYTKYIFSDNTEIKTVHRHRFYNMEKQAMIYMDEWKIGEHAIKQDGTVVELISSELIKETVKHYTIFTKNQNYFANGLLSGNRRTESMHFEAVD